MLRILGKSKRYCDGLTRRNFLQIGALGMGGIALPQILRAEEASGARPSQKSIIMIYLPGGPPHQDTFDLKLDAPSEIRGEFKAIPTNVPGLQICEHLPRLARMMDQVAVIRSMSDARDDHSDFMCLTGRTRTNEPPGGWPKKLQRVILKDRKPERGRPGARMPAVDLARMAGFPLSKVA